MIRDTAHNYAQDHLMPRVVEGFRNEHFHKEMMAEMGQLGLVRSPEHGNVVFGIKY